jgi:hypothetical protein
VIGGTWIDLRDLVEDRRRLPIECRDMVELYCVEESEPEDAK